MFRLVDWKLILGLGMLCLWSACQSTDQETDSTPDELPAVDTTFYQVQVDRLRMRSAPGLNSSTVTLLPEGALIRYWGDHSLDKADITLRGKLISDYWMHVKYGSHQGWVFGGALQEQEDHSVADALIVPGKRVGPILATDSEQSIIDRLGSEQVQRGEFMVGEGEMLEVTYVFPGTEKELILLWTAEDFIHLREVRVTKAASPWKTEEGLAIGSSLKEVEKINGKPFLMSGFQWDYAGSTMSWNLGNIDADLVVTFAEPNRVHRSLLGDHEIRSDDERLRRANPKIQMMRVIFS